VVGDGDGNLKPPARVSVWRWSVTPCIIRAYRMEEVFCHVRVPALARTKPVMDLPRTASRRCASRIFTSFLNMARPRTDGRRFGVWRRKALRKRTQPGSGTQRVPPYILSLKSGRVLGIHFVTNSESKTTTLSGTPHFKTARRPATPSPA